ncbi:MAG: riboflavin biosynthesis protein RibF [bacterium]
MNIYTNIADIDCQDGSVVTIGTFDGLHAGHRALIDTLIYKSAELNFKNILVTFDPHPRNVVNENSKIQTLSTLDEKLKILEHLGVENVLVIKFTKEFSEVNYENFLREYIIKGLNVKLLIIGHDHKFGKDREGNETKLKQFSAQNGFEVISVTSVEIDGEIVSSTKIRNNLLFGKIIEANKFLMQNYFIEGIVVKGSQRGRELGFPTANIKTDDDKLLPVEGVYAVSCKIENIVYFGMMNIGKRPTFDKFEKPIIEINLFEFNLDIYDKKVWIEIYDFIRDEVRFNSKEDLIEQLRLDKATIENYLNLIH